MRFVPSSCLKPGMATARDLYGYNNELMLSRGHILTEIEINRINLLQFPGIYITDYFSRDIEVKSIISSRLRNNAVKSIKDILLQAENRDSSINTAQISKLKNTVDEIIDEITISKDTIVNMLDLKDFSDNTYYHSVNVAVLSLVIGVSLGLRKTNLYRLGLGALLHDIGKVFVSKEILEKRGKLTEYEFEEIKKHTLNGSSYLKERWDIPLESNVAILNHHEKYNGTGYPFRLRQDKISIFGKIIAVADVFDALTSDRPYRNAMLPSDAMEYIMGGGGTLFDHDVTSAFTKRVVPYPVGTCVLLSNNLKGIVAENYMNCCMRPRIKIIDDIGNENNDEEIYYDLCNDRSLLNITITGITAK